ncbi:TIGR02285 family protein [Pseudomonas juntendi]|uniref:TIGR02285 family protein n=1 Tax=Pseudomonas juntendi TaxID=2666183 RepID=A0ABD4YI38_9PSED|nr:MULTISPECIES: TIGR02285 family protein [Pseudomonas]MDG9874288.1 TIGR02285 family protein [Pseudomonas juntendi]MDH0758920.1 TIGR02285 family protein [Pseudomonas juntendi]MDH1919138.1 TIGR02285 family protein [Pseudomonas juntendi]QDR67079.1 TIGR02285 family protein [Pseudomonas sp. BJP69]RRV68433.1 TIGR02285 family protein [Pseudomonas sp. p99-361]
MRAARRLRPLVLLCGLMAALLLHPASAKERLFWLVRDLPPFTIFDGPEQGRGVIDQLLPLLIAQMPEYDHTIQRVNRARGIQMLQDRNTFTCDPTLLWTPQREEYVQFSLPYLGVLSGGLVGRKESQALVAPYLQGQQVDLHGLLSKTALKLGVVAERSYGLQIDSILRQLPDTVLSRHYGNEATANLLQMQQLGRLRLVLGYWPEVRYLIQQQGAALADYQFYPVQGVERYQFLHVGCSDSELGRAAVAHIDQLLLALRRDVLPGLYAHWLDPVSRRNYLEESKRFFEAH